MGETKRGSGPAATPEGAGAGGLDWQPEALHGISVLDLSDSLAGQYCGRLFADGGATVVLGEPERGSRLRRSDPMCADGDGQTRSSLFWHLNCGKLSTHAETATPTGRRLAAPLAAAANVVIVDGDTDLEDLVPATGLPAVVCKISPFGTDGEWASWKGSELVYQALSGIMFENGLSSREPLFGVGHRASYAAGSLAYSQALAAMLAGDPGRHVADVSIAEVAASMSFNRVTQYSYNGTISTRGVKDRPRAMIKCRDGWMSLFIFEKRWREACVGLGLEGLLDDPRFANENLRIANWDACTAEFERNFAQRSVDEIVAAGQKVRAVLARVMSPLELRSDRQLVARGFWDQSEEPGMALPRLGPAYLMSRTPLQSHGGAPGLHDTTRAQALDALTARRTAIVAPGVDVGDDVEVQAPKQRPLEGIRILDLTTAWAGPMASRILAALGADVLKVEGPGRIDDWRAPAEGGLPICYPDLAPGDHPYNRHFMFNTQNHDKRCLAIDLKAEAGRELALRLAAECDVMMANFSAGALDRMGIGWETVSHSNPRLILLEMPSYGSGGPFDHHVGLGPSLEVMSGMAKLIGYGDGEPMTTGPAYLDPIGGMNGAAAVLTALMSRETTGAGQHIEMAQREAAMHWIGEEIIQAVATGKDRTPRGNRIDGVVPHDAFPAAGDDEWVVIAAHSDEEFQRMCSAIDAPGMAHDPDYSSIEARTEHEEALYDRIAEWTRGRDKDSATRDLQSVGIHAAPVSDAGDVARNRFLKYRGLLQEVTHPESGTHVYQGLPLHMDGWDLSIGTPAPLFGQHTAEVLLEVLGLDDSEIAALRDAGVISDRPR